MNSINITCFLEIGLGFFLIVFFFSYLASPKQSLFEHDWMSKPGAAGSKAIIRLIIKIKQNFFF